MTLNTQELKEQYVTANIEIGRLKSKLKEADEIIKFYGDNKYYRDARDRMDMSSIDLDGGVKAREYLSQIDKNNSKDVTTRDTLSVDKEDNNE